MLREDPDLAEAIDPARREQAIDECTVRELSLPPGRWNGVQNAPPEAGMGYLVLGGVLIRRVAINSRAAAELVGEGDLLRPWNGDEAPLLPMAEGSWSVAEPARLAVLDERFARQLARYPELAGRLLARAIRRSRLLALNLAIVHHARVTDRLHMLLWLYAGRWGRVRGDGVLLSLRLTHTILADLVAARRPTVTSALSELSKRGLVRTVSEGWLLSGDPPSELNTLISIGKVNSH
jgi:CRP-like cAMP-binding protein